MRQGGVGSDLDCWSLVLGRMYDQKAWESLQLKAPDISYNKAANLILKAIWFGRLGTVADHNLGSNRHTYRLEQATQRLQQGLDFIVGFGQKFDFPEAIHPTFL